MFNTQKKEKNKKERLGKALDFQKLKERTKSRPF